jgi:hypothetical protein
MTLHLITFARNPYSGLWHAACTCNWSLGPGPKLAIQTAAGLHDLNQENPDFQTGLEFAPHEPR